MNGEDAMVTVLFVDVRDFTRFADSATAREAVALLNEFFGVVVPVLEAHGGHANKVRSCDFVDRSKYLGEQTIHE